MPRLMSAPAIQPDVLRRRPSDLGTIYGHSTDHVYPSVPAILDRPTPMGGRNHGSERDNNGKHNDQLINRQRVYLWRQAVYIRPGDTPGNHSWTNDGPIRDMPTTRFNRNIRPIVGGSNADRWGMHTNIPSGQKAGNQLAGKSKMVAGRQNRLTVQRYRGQSYSSTTRLQS